MKPLTRREALYAMSASAAALCPSATAACGQSVPAHGRLGIVIYALGIHQRNQWAGRHQGLAAGVAFLEECHRLGAGGIQYPFTASDAGLAREVRRRAEGHAMHVEAILEPPCDTADVERFEQTVRVAQEAGASVARTVILPGRRYEQFQSLAEFREFEARGLQSLQLAEPILAHRNFRLAVENHKDQRIDEKLALLKRLSSEFIGLCVDVGNNFPLLEDPLELRRRLPRGLSRCTSKTRRCANMTRAFSWRTLPRHGFLDLPRIVKTLRNANPDIKFNLETITRDALEVPVLTERFWVTLRDTPASALARHAAVLKTQSHPEPFATISQLPLEAQVDFEHRNVEESLAYAKKHLGLKSAGD